MVETSQKIAKNGAYWTLGSNIAQLIARIGILSILARLIGPEEFGVFATFMIIFEFAKIGFVPFVNKNLILNKKDNEFTSSAIVVSLAHGMIIAILIFFLAPTFGLLFDMEELPKLLQVGSSLIVIVSISNPLTSMIEKDINFTWLAKRKLFTSLFGSGVVTVIFAYLNYGVWALLLGIITAELTNGLFVYFKRPVNLFLFSATKIKKVYQDALNISLTGLVNKLAIKGDYLVISFYLGASSLGVYSKAFQLMGLPVNVLGKIFDKNIFSSLAQHKGNLKSQADIFKKFTFIVFFSMMMLTVLAHYFSVFIINLILGPDWVSTTPIFQILSLGYFFRLGYKISGTFLSVQRRFKALLFSQVIFALSVITFSILLINFKEQGVAWAMLIGLSLTYVLMTTMQIKHLDIKISDLLKINKKPVFFISIMVLIIELLSFLLNDLPINVRPIVASFILLSAVLFLIKSRFKILGPLGFFWYKKFTH